MKKNCVLQKNTLNKHDYEILQLGENKDIAT